MSGQARRRKERFFNQNPYCCFCGGKTKATTVDHMPSRGFFRGRVAPEGYEFPACNPCQAVTATDELLVQMIMRIQKRSVLDDGSGEVDNLIRGVNNNFPGLLAAMNLPATKKRKLLRDSGTTLPQGMTTADVPALSLEDDRIHSAVRQVARKLFFSLHYRHTSSIVPSGGGVAFRWWSNYQVWRGDIPEGVTAALNQFAEIKRAKTSLNEQFGYNYGVADTKRMGAYLVFFNEASAMFGTVAFDAARLEIAIEAEPATEVEILSPFSW